MFYVRVDRFELFFRKMFYEFFCRKGDFILNRVGCISEFKIQRLRGNLESYCCREVVWFVVGGEGVLVKGLLQLSFSRILEDLMEMLLSCFMFFV